MAADDMAIGQFDAQARYAALDERVTNLRTSMVNLEGEMRSGFVALNSHLTAMSTELRGSQKTQWPVIWAAAGVMFSVLMGIGGALYLPIRGDLAEQADEIKALRSNTLGRDELDQRTARAAEDRARTEAAFSQIRDQMWPKSEHELFNQFVTQRFDDQQRQIDDLKKRP